MENGNRGNMIQLIQICNRKFHYFEFVKPIEDVLKINEIEFAKQKPICQFLLDDRAMQFKGEFPTDLEILNFRPWHGKDIW